MCIAKKSICGENTVALEFHGPTTKSVPFSRTLWIPPMNLDFPLPEPFMVGIRNEEDRKNLILKSMTYREHR